MKADISSPWIQAGYKIFALEGPQGLKVERLSKIIGKNKSSFYHLFSDLDLFIEDLLQYHLAQAKIMAQKEAACPSKEVFIEIIVEHKIDLLFNRQLRIHREQANFKACFLQTNEITGKSIVGIWAKILNLQHHSYLAELVYRLSLENFFLQITEETINPVWLNNYFDELRNLVKAFEGKDKAEHLGR